MKKIISLIIMFIFIMAPVKSYAANEKATVNIKINGELKVGNEIEIIVDVENIENLYAISTELRYDSSLIKVTSIEGGSFIKGDGENQMEVPAKLEDGRASYGITLIGDVETRKGSGNITTIKAKVLKDGGLKINKDNIFIKLVERTPDKEIRAINYTLNGTEKKEPGITGDIPTGEESGGTTDKPNENNSNTNIEDKNESTTDTKEETKDDVVKSENNQEKTDDELGVEKEENKSEENNDEEVKNEKNYQIYIIGIIVIVGLGGLCFYYKKKKQAK